MIELVCYHTKSANLSLIIYIVHTRYIYIKHFWSLQYGSPWVFQQRSLGGFSLDDGNGQPINVTQQTRSNKLAIRHTSGTCPNALQLTTHLPRMISRLTDRVVQ
jgi:hypothetical protein